VDDERCQYCVENNGFERCKPVAGRNS
jgi:hypothetical protein